MSNEQLIQTLAEKAIVETKQQPLTPRDASTYVVDKVELTTPELCDHISEWIGDAKSHDNLKFGELIINLEPFINWLYDKVTEVVETKLAA